jgi:nucleoside-diphosphate-sugar epimerase
MHILILGKGFMGSRLVRRFSAIHGWRVDVLGSQDCDLTDEASQQHLRRIVTPDTCVLFTSTISRLREDSERSFFSNVRMAENVGLALSQCQYRSLVFCSSIDVYGRPPTESPISEETPVRPAGFYGHSKLASEFFLSSKLGHNQNLAILRLPGVYALDEGDPSALGAIFDKLRNNHPVNLSGGGRQVRTYVSVSELGSVVESIFTRRWAGLMNVGSSTSYSLLDSVSMMKEYLASTSPILATASNGTEFDLVVSSIRLHADFPDARSMSLASYLLSMTKGRAPYDLGRPSLSGDIDK